MLFPSSLVVSSSSALPKNFGTLLSSSSSLSSFVSSLDPPKKFGIILPVPPLSSSPLSSSPLSSSPLSSSSFVSSLDPPKKSDASSPPPSSPPPSPPPSSSPPPS